MISREEHNIEKAGPLEVFFRSVLPSPFSISLILTGVAFVLAFLLARPEGVSGGSYFLTLQKYWVEGIWNVPLLVFALQMMLMLVLGHVLALSPPVHRLIVYVTQRLCINGSLSVYWVCLLTILVSLFNWGLGLIFGAILARKIGEIARMQNMPVNYPLLGAAGYSGLMVWHGGLSGSSLVKAAEPGHLRNMLEPFVSASTIQELPLRISYSESVFSSMNMMVSLTLIVLLPLAMYLLARGGKTSLELPRPPEKEVVPLLKATGAERLDQKPHLGLIFGIFALIATATPLLQSASFNLDFINPNWINLLLLSLALIAHRSVQRFSTALEHAIGDTSGILIQFPIYFGIMGIMGGSGMIENMSDFFAQNSTAFTFPLFTFFSAGIVNIFIPSGGGQWALQGPIILQTALELGIPLPKSILALAYGDQLTNMLQPFWALPLLGITGLKAREILPYTLVLLMLGGCIFFGALLIF